MNFQEEFDLLIHDYSLGKISSDPIVSLMLNNVSNNKEYLKCISTFRDEAEKLNKSEDYAFSFAMLSFSARNLNILILSLRYRGVTSIRFLINSS